MNGWLLIVLVSCFIVVIIGILTYLAVGQTDSYLKQYPPVPEQWWQGYLAHAGYPSNTPQGGVVDGEARYAYWNGGTAPFAP